MTFLQLAQYVRNNAAPDGDSTLALPPLSGPYFATPFGARLALLIRLFTTEVPLLYATMHAIEIPATLREYNLADPANASVSFWDVHALWVEGQRIRRANSAEEVMKWWAVDGPTGAPTAFAHVTKNKLVFDTKPSAGLDGCYARGFFKHAAIAADTDVIDAELEDKIDLFERYAQVNLRQDVAGDDVGLQRLARVDKQAYAAIQKIVGERNRMILDPRRCG